GDDLVVLPAAVRHAEHLRRLARAREGRVAHRASRGTPRRTPLPRRQRRARDVASFRRWRPHGHGLDVDGQRRRAPPALPRNVARAPGCDHRPQRMARQRPRAAARRAERRRGHRVRERASSLCLAPRQLWRRWRSALGFAERRSGLDGARGRPHSDALAGWKTATLARWRELAGTTTYDGPYRDNVAASLRQLRLLVFEPSGAIIAAVTAALPEVLGGKRHHDYRYARQRDTATDVP